MFVIVDDDDRPVEIPDVNNSFKSMDTAIDVLTVVLGDPKGYAVLDERDITN